MRRRAANLSDSRAGIGLASPARKFRVAVTKARNPVARRKQFTGICHDILETFSSRYNDLDGYWALGQCVAFLKGCGADRIQFNLRSALISPENASFNVSAMYYQEALFRMMDANGMPRGWFSEGFVSLAVVGPTNAVCNIKIVSDLNKAYRFERTINVRPHDPSRELQRKGKFGPSNQKGH